MRIAMVLPDLRGGGAEKLSLDLAHAFAQRGHEVTIVLLRAEGDLLAQARNSFEVVELSVLRLRQGVRPLRRWLLSARPDAVLAAIWPLTTLTIIAAMGTGCRVVVSDHNPLSLQYSGWGRAQNAFLRHSIGLLYPFAAARVGVSAGVARDLEALGRLARGSVAVIHNPVPVPAEPDSGEMARAEALWRPGAARRILTVGRLKSMKNHALLLRAFARLGGHTQLMLVGAGELQSDLARQASALGIAEQVTFAGFQPNPTPFYRSADLFVLSSDYEGFGNVIVEALANGLPVVSTDCPHGPAEILKGGEFGRLVPPGDEAALAAAMRASLDTPTDPERLKRRAADFDPSRAAAAYLRLLHPAGASGGA